LLSCDVIILDDNTPLFYFSWKLHSLARPYLVSTGLNCESHAQNRLRSLNVKYFAITSNLFQDIIIPVICYASFALSFCMDIFLKIINYFFFKFMARSAKNTDTTVLSHEIRKIWFFYMTSDIKVTHHISPSPTLNTIHIMQSKYKKNWQYEFRKLINQVCTVFLIDNNSDMWRRYGFTLCQCQVRLLIISSIHRARCT
jgi:hypothetical protein